MKLLMFLHLAQKRLQEYSVLSATQQRLPIQLTLVTGPVEAAFHSGADAAAYRSHGQGAHESFIGSQGCDSLQS